MADNLTSEQRSRCMSKIRSTNTLPEWTVRRLVFDMGYRYRLHRRDLPGTPDLVFPRLRRVVFVHGCFWHGHSCQKGRMPKSNSSYWTAKRTRNITRDRQSTRKLRRAGWRVLTVWECETRDLDNLRRRIGAFLSRSGTRKTKSPRPRARKANLPYTSTLGTTLRTPPAI
jgi:DNA mismatch endonuclease (patch repair protein)